ncbi:VOC family protein [Sphingobium quisquiliarum]|nr:VOC family protein [Sphingobium quisquiliarum]
MTAIAFALAKFKVADLEGLEQFYTRALGFVVTARVDEGEDLHEIHELIFALPDAPPQFALVQYPNQPTPQPGEAIVALMVDDLEATLSRVEAHGGRRLTDVIPVPDHNMKLAYVADPEGHTLELMQMLAG